MSPNSGQLGAQPDPCPGSLLCMELAVGVRASRSKNIDCAVIVFEPLNRPDNEDMVRFFERYFQPRLIPATDIVYELDDPKRGVPRETSSSKMHDRALALSR